MTTTASPKTISNHARRSTRSVLHFYDNNTTVATQNSPSKVLLLLAAATLTSAEAVCKPATLLVTVERPALPFSLSPP